MGHNREYPPRGTIYCEKDTLPLRFTLKIKNLFSPNKENNDTMASAPFGGGGRRGREKSRESHTRLPHFLLRPKMESSLAGHG